MAKKKKNKPVVTLNKPKSERNIIREIKLNDNATAELLKASQEIQIIKDRINAYLGGILDILDPNRKVTDWITSPDGKKILVYAEEKKK